MVDSASVPLPIDVLVAGWAWTDRRHFYLYALLAAAGSAIGGLVPFFIGRGGGELILLRHINREKLDELRNRFQKQEFLGIMIPSLLPPPATWKLFVLAAGVFEMRTLNFMLAVFIGRLVRFGIETALTVEYGPQIVTVLGDFAKRHFAITIVLLLILFGGLGWYIWRKMKTKPPTPQNQVTGA
jgi:membrane protein YqaA with SNARE-associated domain